MKLGAFVKSFRKSLRRRGGRRKSPAARRGTLGLATGFAAGPSSAQFIFAQGSGCKDVLSMLRREQKELQDALFEGSRVQKKLCAPRELRRGPVEMAGEMFAVRQLCGDFFKLMDLGNSVGLAVGDIAGKGIAAGMWLAHLVALAQEQLAEQPEVSAAMAGVNRSLCGLVSEPPLAALLLGRIDLHTGELSYCNAGQPDAQLLRRGVVAEALGIGGPMLGAIPNAAFETGRVALNPGDTLIACTDGAMECRNTRDDEFGPSRLAAAAAAADGSASQILFSTLGAVLDFADGRPLADDLTLVVLHRRGSAVS